MRVLEIMGSKKEAAKRASAAKSDFMSKMFHDIRTPMNAIIGMTAIAAAQADNPGRVKDALGKISASSRHLLGLINEVLDMSKIESGTISLAMEQFSLSDLLNSMLLMIQPQIQAHKHHLQVHIQEIQHENVIGGSLRIQQVFLNLMSNAVKYTPDDGEISFTVTIYLNLQDTQDVDTSELAELSVLVVDDDECACRSLCAMLDEIGMRSESCTSGQEAVAAVSRTLHTGRAFYAAIPDWKMPGMDGLDTARAIKALVGDALPIIILSAYDWSDIETEAQAAGVDAFLSKPVFKSGLIRMFKAVRSKEEKEGIQREYFYTHH